MERKENVVEGSLPLGIFSLLGVSLVIWKEASIQRRDWRNRETTSGLTSTICDTEHPRSSGSLSSSEWQFVVVSMPTPDVYCHRFCLVPRHTKGSQEFLNGKFPGVSLTKLDPIQQGQTKQALAKCKGDLGHRSELINRCTFLKELTLS